MRSLPLEYPLRPANCSGALLLYTAALALAIHSSCHAWMWDLLLCSVWRGPWWGTCTYMRSGMICRLLRGRIAIYSALTDRAKSHVFKVKGAVPNIPKQFHFVADRLESKQNELPWGEWIIKDELWCSLPEAYFRISKKLLGIQNLNLASSLSNRHTSMVRIQLMRPLPEVNLLFTEKISSSVRGQ